MPDELEYSCDICGMPIRTSRGLAIHKTRVHSQTEEAELIDPEASVYSEEVTPRDPNPVEIAPEGPPTWREKLWGKDKPSQPKVVIERRPRKRRASTEGVWVTLWTAAGLGLVRTGADIPLGNCLQFQAPIVGEVLDDAIAGTFLDGLLQPIAGKGKKFKAVSSVLAMPILVGAIERSPGAAPILEPLLRQAIQEHLVAMAPVIKARQKAEEQYRKALDELGMDGGDDPVDAVISAIFPMMGAPEHNGAGKMHADAP